MTKQEFILRYLESQSHLGFDRIDIHIKLAAEMWDKVKKECEKE